MWNTKFWINIQNKYIINIGAILNLVYCFIVLSFSLDVFLTFCLSFITCFTFIIQEGNLLVYLTFTSIPFLQSTFANGFVSSSSTGICFSCNLVFDSVLCSCNTLLISQLVRSFMLLIFIYTCLVVSRIIDLVWNCLDFFIYP